MKTTAKILSAVALLALIFAAGYVTRSHVAPNLPDETVGRWLYEHQGETNYGFSRTTHLSLHAPLEFSREAYQAMTTEAKSMLEWALGQEAPFHHIYVFPTLGGFEVHLHYPPEAIALSNEQANQLHELIRSRMSDLSQAAPQPK